MVPLLMVCHLHGVHRAWPPVIQHQRETKNIRIRPIQGMLAAERAVEMKENQPTYLASRLETWRGSNSAKKQWISFVLDSSCSSPWSEQAAAVFFVF